MALRNTLGRLLKTMLLCLPESPDVTSARVVGPPPDRVRRRDEAALLEERTTMRVIAGTLLFGLLLSAAVNVGASTITASSCSASAVQAALNRASAGDTVFIPAGTCSWTTGV